MANLKPLDNFDLLLDLRKVAPLVVSDEDMIALADPFRSRIGSWLDDAQYFEDSESLTEMRTTIESCGNALDVEVDDALADLDNLLSELPDDGGWEDNDEGRGGGGGCETDSSGDIDSLFDSLRG